MEGATSANFHHYVEVMDRLMEFISKEQKVRVAATPFGHLLWFPYTKQRRPLLDALLYFWDDEKEGFRFGKVVIPFMRIDIVLIFDLRAMDDKVELYREGRVQSNLIIQFFDGDHKKTTRNLVKNKLMYLVGKSGLQDVEDFIKCWILYVFVTILFPTIHYHVPKALCLYLDDLDHLKSYSWDRTIFYFFQR